MGGGRKQTSQGYMVFKWTQSSKEILRLCISAIFSHEDGRRWASVISSFQNQMQFNKDNTILCLIFYFPGRGFINNQEQCVTEKDLCLCKCTCLCLWGNYCILEISFFASTAPLPSYPLHPSQICAFSFSCLLKNQVWAAQLVSNH